MTRSLAGPRILESLELLRHSAYAWGAFYRDSAMSQDHTPDAATRDEDVDKAGFTEQDEEYRDQPLPPVEERIRHWHHWRNGGLVCSGAGIVMLIAGHFAASGRAMQIAGFLILAGAVIFTVGVIGGWITHERPLD